ncbi:hypothetical protein Ancab_000814 [Ancistrocladus abbreviatus]
MNRAPGLHSKFFSSLKQVEKRLKIENPSSTAALSLPPPCVQLEPPSQPSQTNCIAMDSHSLSSPLHLYIEHQSNQSSKLQDSEPPNEFLSNSSGFLPSHEDLYPQNHQSQQEILDQYETNIDDIQLLMQLLGLTDLNKEESNDRGNQGKVNLGLKCNDNDCENCYCGGGFYEKIVGMKDPKCAKEVQRLEGWIRYLGNNGCKERAEPLRLAHLVLGKAALVSTNSGVFEGLEFPSTVHEFLQNDPPPD